MSDPANAISAAVSADSETEIEYQLGFNQQDERIRLLIGAWLGTVLAGGVFGVLLFIWELVLPIKLDLAFASAKSAMVCVCNFVVGCTLGFVLGTLWAGFIGLGIATVAVLILAGLGTVRLPALAASFFGAWTAFVCCGNFAWVAIILGQIGATWGAAKLIAVRTEPADSSQATWTARFGLGQLFRFTTVVCVCLAVVSLLPLEEKYRVGMGYCLVWQVASVLTIVCVQLLWARRFT